MFSRFKLMRKQNGLGLVSFKYFFLLEWKLKNRNCNTDTLENTTTKIYKKRMSNISVNQPCIRFYLVKVIHYHFVIKIVDCVFHTQFHSINNNVGVKWHSFHNLNQLLLLVFFLFFIALRQKENIMLLSLCTNEH